MRFRRFTLSVVCVCAWALTTVPSAHASAVLPLDGTWITLDDLGSGTMLAGYFFTDNGTSGSPTLPGAQTWSWTSNAWVKFDITDYFVATDRYNVYDNSVQFGSLIGGTEWELIPGCDGNPLDLTCHWAGTPDIAWGDPIFAQGSFYFAPGAHAIAIQDVEIPLMQSGDPFPDGTVAFRASETPEPASLLLLATGLAGAIVRFRRKR